MKIFFVSESSTPCARTGYRLAKALQLPQRKYPVGEKKNYAGWYAKNESDVFHHQQGRADECFVKVLYYATASIVRGKLLLNVQ